VHQDFGVVDLEVKAHRVVIERGQWCFGEHRNRFDEAPPKQAKDNAYALRNLLRASLPHLEHLHVQWGLAFPNTTRIAGALPPDVRREQVLLSADIDEPTYAVEVLATLGYTAQRLTADDVSHNARTCCSNWSVRQASSV